MEVLLIEDNAGDAVLIRQILAESGAPIKLTIARDGEQALQMLESDRFIPDLIMLDLNIPKVPGLSVLMRNPRKDVPVVVFSSSLSEVERRRALDLGAREFVQKPVDIEAFAEAVLAIVLKWAQPRVDSASNGAS